MLLWIVLRRWLRIVDNVQMAVPMVVGYFILGGIAQKPIAQRIVHNNDDLPKTISSFNSDGRREKTSSV